MILYQYMKEVVTMAVERWVSMDEICDHMGVSRDTIKKMIKLQNMPAYKFDRKWKFKISEVDTWLHETYCLNSRNEGK